MTLPAMCTANSAAQKIIDARLNYVGYMFKEYILEIDKEKPNEEESDEESDAECDNNTTVSKRARTDLDGTRPPKRARTDVNLDVDSTSGTQLNNELEQVFTELLAQGGDSNWPPYPQYDVDVSSSGVDERFAYTTTDLVFHGFDGFDNFNFSAGITNMQDPLLDTT